MIRTRIAPSPTGKDVHVGTVATALMNWAWAKKNNGRFIIRVEDTDRSRLVKGGEQAMLSTLNRLGLIADESPEVGGKFGPYRQSERLDIYKKYAEELVQKGHAYYCICTPKRLAEMRKQQQAQKQIPKYDRHCMEHVTCNIKHETYKGSDKYVIRLKIPEDREIKFQDVIRGEIKFNSNDIDDQVLLKSDGYPTYHLAVVVDDHLMEISHVIRAEEWLSSTPKHVVLYEALGWKLPVFSHVSLLRNPDKSKLSKRKNPVWASDYLDQGIFPEVLLNYLALMGWSHPQGKEIFSMDEYVKVFDLKDIQKSAPVFDTVKLEWMSGEYIRACNMKHITYNILQYIGDKYDKKLVEKTIPLVQERMKKLYDYLPLCEFFFKKPETYEINLETYKNILKQIEIKLKQINDWKADTIGEEMQNVAKEIGMKNSEFFMMLRVAITGKKISPPLNESMEILGKEECLKRVVYLL